METNNRQKILLIGAVVGLALLIGNSVIFEPLKAKWDARQAQIKQLKHDVDEAEALIRHRTTYERRWASMQTNALPGNPSGANFALQAAVERWEQASGVKHDSIRMAGKTDTDSGGTNIINTLECQADFSGNMRSVLNFLWAVESDPMGLKLDPVVIGSRGDNNGQQLTLNITLSGLMLDTEQPQQPQTQAQHP
jgi:hypothetical protein